VNPDLIIWRFSTVWLMILSSTIKTCSGSSDETLGPCIGRADGEEGLVDDGFLTALIGEIVAEENHGLAAEPVVFSRWHELTVVRRRWQYGIQ
jgi:hypothetical protein